VLLLEDVESDGTIFLRSLLLCWCGDGCQRRVSSCAKKNGTVGININLASEKGTSTTMESGMLSFRLQFHVYGGRTKDLEACALL
jgi:hypothetical protein